MKKINHFIGFIGVLFCMVLFTGCTREDSLSGKEKAQISFYAMDTYMTFTAYGAEESILRDAEEEIGRIEKLFSVTDKDSELFFVNHQAGKGSEGVKITDELAEVLEISLDLGKKSGGAFDITIYPVLKLWGFTTGNYQVPNEGQIEEGLAKTGYEKVELSGEEGQFSVFLQEGMEIDFGGIAKGYAGDKAAGLLKERGVKSAVLSLGGNIQTVGSKPDGSKWNVAVKDPRQPETYLGVVKIGEKAVVTSGGYERFFEDEQGNLWWHILNPADGYPAKSGLLSVTVIGDRGVLCDALSTLLFVKGEEGAADYWRKYGGFDMILVTEEDELYVTETIRDSFSPAGNYEQKQVHVIKK